METASSSHTSVLVNGEPRSFAPGETVATLLSELGLQPELVAVELNRAILRREAFAGQRLEPGDRIEIVEFVGGG